VVSNSGDDPCAHLRNHLAHALHFSTISRVTQWCERRKALLACTTEDSREIDPGGMLQMSQAKADRA